MSCATRADSRGVKFAKSTSEERREHRRHVFEEQGTTFDRWAGARREGKTFGRIVDLSAGGVRIRTEQTDVKPDNQIRVRIELPAYAGIAPFIDTTKKGMASKREWIGWMAVARGNKVDGKTV